MNALTKPQAKAMRAFLCRAYGYEDTASDGQVWEQGVRPWPTMDNLALHGLIKYAGWFSPEDGREWLLTDAGRDYMRSVVAAGTP